jgi:uncharacterized membrane protein (UPF0182 family)
VTDRPEERPTRLPRRRRGRVVLVSAVVVFLFSISGIVVFYTDLLWYSEVRLRSVLLTIFTWKVLLALAFGLAFFLLAAINLFIVGRIMPAYRLADPNDNLERYREAFLPYMRWLAIGGSAILALFFAVGVTAYWDRFALATHMVPFGVSDPVFHKDVAFYVFRLPLYQFVYGWLFSAVMVVTLVVAGAHYMTGGIRPQAPGGVLPQVKAHLSVLIGLIALLKAWGYRLDQYELLYSLRGVVTGASYTDVHAELPALKLLVIISVIAALLFLVNIRIRGWALPLAGLGLWLLTSALAASAFPFFVQRFSVQPAELTKERPFIERNIQATRVAYGLDDVSVREYPAKSNLTAEDVAANSDTIRNIRLWDTGTLTKAYQQLQAIKPYYKFFDVDVDRYRLGDKTRQVMLAARELDPGNLDAEENWQNLHIVYTHGYGAVANLSAEKTVEGQPTFALRDIPPQPVSPELRIEQGGVYFGEGLSRDYAVVRTTQPELDYPTEEGNQYKRYAGNGGVPLEGLVRRLAFAWRFRNVNLAISGLIEDDSRIVFYRKIDERIRKAAPFLRFDSDPYAVVVGGRIKWMADGYTVSGMYPYAERVDLESRTGARGPGGLNERNNYVRNSVKAVVDAYDGTVDFYVWDEQDPIIKAWGEVFPDLLKPKSQMDPALREHVRYPEDLFKIQTWMYLRYHVTDPQDFFTRTDAWVIPNDPVRPAPATPSAVSEIEPYYVLMQLPGETAQSYVMILPMNPRGRQNMVAWFAAKSDPDDFGRLIDFRFPKTRTVEGVNQIHARINQTEVISRERTLLGTTGLGSKVSFGNLLVVPIQDALLYVQPLYLEAEDTPIPELKNVILATSERVVMGTTLDDALKQLLEGGGEPTSGGEETGGTGGVPPTLAQLLDQARQHFDAADAALKAGDWATYGKEEQAARDAIRQATGVAAPSPPASPPASPSPVR